MATETKILHRLDEFKSPLARLSYAQSLFTPRVQEEGKAPKYGCTLIFPNSAKAEFGKLIEKLIRETPGWGEKGLERFKKEMIKNPILKGDGKEAHNQKTGELNLGMGPDVFFIRPNSGANRPPAVWWKSTTIRETETNVYSGCYGKAVLNMYSYHHPKSGDGIGIGISGFHKQGEGDRLGGSGSIDPEKWNETIADDGPAPDSTKSGAGASGLFD